MVTENQGVAALDAGDAVERKPWTPPVVVVLDIGTATEANGGVGFDGPSSSHS